MGKKVYILFFAAVLIFSASQAVAQTPIEFNDNLVSITDSLYIKGQAWGKQFGEIRESKAFYKLTPQRKTLEKFIDAKIAEVSVMKDVSGSADLRKAMITFLLFEKDMIHTAFVPIEKLNESSTDEEIDAALEKLTNLTKDENNALLKVNTEQEAYAKKNGFTIESATE